MIPLRVFIISTLPGSAGMVMRKHVFLPVFLIRVLVFVETTDLPQIQVLVPGR